MNIEEFVSTKASKLAELTGVSEAQWSLYFNGVRSPSLRTICRLAKVLKMTPQDLTVAMLRRIQLHCYC